MTCLLGYVIKWSGGWVGQKLTIHAGEELSYYSPLHFSLRALPLRRYRINLVDKQQTRR
jgi:hypothetical protein